MLQRSETDNPDEHVEPAEYSVHPFELVEVIVEIDGVLVGRGVVVLEREAAQHVILECGHLFVRIDVLEREDDVAYPRVVLHVDEPACGVGNEDAVLVAVGVILVDTRDGPYHAVLYHLFPYWRFVAEKYFSDGLADDAYLSLSVDVLPVDEASLQYLNLEYFGMFGADTVHGR